MYQDINSVEMIRDILDTIKIDQAFFAKSTQFRIS